MHRSLAVNVIRSLEAFTSASPVVLTLGTFDGVHRGHRRILEHVVAISERSTLHSLLLTFDPHPREVIGRKGEQTYLLTTIEERIELLRNERIDTCLVLPFTRDMSMLDARTFFQEYIVRGLRAAHVVVGMDHAFGKGRSGSADELRLMGDKRNIEVTIVGELLVDGAKVSSSAIRNALAAGDVERARKFLGRPYQLAAFVIRGAGLGRQLGFPTANLDIHDRTKMLPRSGVYIVSVHIGDDEYTGLLNIGRRPTLSKQMHISSEVHIFNFSGNLYGLHVRVGLLERLRDEIRFDTKEQLVSQIRTDIERAQDRLQQRI